MDPRERCLIATDLREHAAERGWSRWDLVQEIQAKTHTPTLLMAWRLACGYTQQNVIGGLSQTGQDAETPCAPNTSQISRWECGADSVGPFYRYLFCTFYGAPPDKLGFPAPSRPIAAPPMIDSEGDDVDRRRFLGLAATAVPAIAPLDEARRRLDQPLQRLLPSADIDHWREVANRHIAAYGTSAPGDILAALANDLDEISTLASRYSHQRALQVIAAQMCGLIGALHTDLGDDTDARDWLATASGYARLADHTPMRTWIAMAQAMLAYYRHRPGEVITIAEHAHCDIGDSVSAAQVQLTGLVARAHARLGDHDTARAELTAATQIFPTVPEEEATDTFFGFPETQLTMYESSVLSLIGDPGAWNAQTTALDAYAGDPMSYSLVLLDRAHWQLHRDSVDVAAANAITAIADLRPAERLPLLVDQANAIGEAIAARSPEAAEQYRSQMNQYAA